MAFVKHQLSRVERLKQEKSSAQARVEVDRQALAAKLAATENAHLARVEKYQKMVRVGLSWDTSSNPPTTLRMGLPDRTGRQCAGMHVTGLWIRHGRPSRWHEDCPACQPTAVADPAPGSPPQQHDC
eukprot:SAG22_NODE_962_length_6280_cov_4.343472_8_plen_127_part_00